MKIYSLPKDEKAILKKWQGAEDRDEQLERAVYQIISEVKKHGDNALLKFAKQFDGIALTQKTMRISQKRLKEAWDNSSPELKKSLRLAEKNIREFHRKQVRKSWTLKRKNGVKLTQRIMPLDRIGIYVPGGRAVYPSSVLMDAIPAQEAGVKEIVLVTPPQKPGAFNDSALAATYMLGIQEAYSIGGAQAVAALAYGTKIIKRVDKVVGPGNKYVATAKRLLFGMIDIDSIAGPSEILIIADKTAPLDFITADLFSQAEHDEDAVAILILIGEYPLEQLLKNIKLELKNQPRASIIKKSLENNGMIIKARNKEDAIKFAQIKSPEHLEIMISNPYELADKIKNAGAIFLGKMTPEPIGDYVAGPNHVLPTGGTARFSSPLCVDDFMKISNCLEYTEEGILSDGQAALVLATTEGLSAHAQSVEKRLNYIKKRSNK